MAAEWHRLPDRRMQIHSAEHRPSKPPPLVVHRRSRSLGLGLIAGAADDDPSAIGTYAGAGATFGLGMLWTSPFLLPMMIVVVYLASKLGQVTGRGLAGAIREYCPAWILYAVVTATIVGNTVEAGADLGGVAASFQLLFHVPAHFVALAAAAIILGFKFLGDYGLLRNAFRYLALALLAYVGSAFMARPSLWPVIKATILPTIHFSRPFLEMLVAVIGTSMSPYLYIWQASQEVEEDISVGRRRLDDRQGTSRAGLKATAWDIIAGMVFSNVVMYFIILSTAATIYRTGSRPVSTAGEAASALQPLLGNAAGIIFALGVIGVGFLAIPVMTAGIAYAVCETFGWKSGLSARPAEAKPFYIISTVAMAAAVALNFLHINPMRALVWAGLVQGLLAPGLLILIVQMTASRDIMGRWANSTGVNVLAWITTAAVCAAALGLVIVSL